MDVDMWMFVEYLEAKEHIHAVKERNFKIRTKREHKGIDPLWVSLETSSSNLLRTEKKE